MTFRLYQTLCRGAQVVGMIVACAALIALNACKGDQEGAAPAGSRPALGGAPSGATQAASPGATAASAPVLAASGDSASNLLQNGNFDQWAGGKLAAWEHVRYADTTVTRSDAPHDGKPAIVFASKGGDLGYLEQKLADGADLKQGGTLEASAWVKTAEANKVSLVFMLVPSDANAHRQYVQDWHPGDDQWHDLSVKWKVPGDAATAIKEVDVQLRIDQGNTKPFEVAQVQAAYQ